MFKTRPCSKLAPHPATVCSVPELSKAPARAAAPSRVPALLALHGSCWPRRGRSDAVSFASLRLRPSLSWFSHSFVLNYSLISSPPSSICSLGRLFSRLVFSSFSFCCLLLDFLPSFLSHLAVLSLIPSAFFFSFFSPVFPLPSPGHSQSRWLFPRAVPRPRCVPFLRSPASWRSAPRPGARCRPLSFQPAG